MRIIHRGLLADARVLSPREARLAALMPPKARTDTSCRLVCPMPGTVVSLAVAEGQEVRTGEALCVVEAMKMENILRADRDATVRRILASPGDSLAVDAIIMEFE
jgi:propionyl-CoA carboxylase alpha chain